MFGNDTLYNYTYTNFFLATKYNYSITELENMVPYEREAIIILLEQMLQKEKEYVAKSR